MTNIGLASPHAISATRLSSRAVYFIQTGGSALSNTYLCHYQVCGAALTTPYNS